MTNKTNKYQYTRTIVFGGKLRSGSIGQVSKISFDEVKELLKELFANLQNLQDSYEKFVFFENDEGEKRVSKFVELKKQFLREYASEYLYKGKNVNNKNFTADKIERSLKLFSQKNEILKEFINNLEKILNRFDHPAGVAQGDAMRKSSIAIYIKSLNKKDAFPFFELLSNMGKNTKNGNYENDFRISVELTKRTLDKLLPVTAKSNYGIEIARASLNYFTVDKNAHKYHKKSFDEILSEARSMLYDDKRSPREWFRNYQLVRQSGLEEYLNDKGLSKISLEGLYQEMKTYKAKEKQKLNELVDKYLSQGEGGKDLFIQEASTLKLFNNNIATLRKFFDRKREIHELNKEYQKTNNYKLKNKLSNLRKATGNFFRDKRYGFNIYVSFCNDLYKDIAIIRGKEKAKIVQLLLEQEEARLLKYWALFYEEDGKGKGVVLIPKEKRQKARAFLRQKTANPGDKYALSELQSLTAKAIRKRIQQDFPEKTVQLYNSEYEQKRIQLFKDALVGTGEFSGINYEIPDEIEDYINEIIKKNYSTFEQFREDLEKVFYVSKKYAFDSADNIKEFADKFNGIFITISGYDFERSITGDKKEFTKVWEKYWSNENKSNNYPLRINPEIRIFVRPKQKDKHPESRFSRDTIHLHFSITDNAASKEFIPPLIHEKEVEKYIDKFNIEIIDPYIADLDRKNKLWYYGIDRGNQELATLGIVRWTQEQYKVMVGENEVSYNKPDFAKIDVYVPKDLFASKAIYTSKKAEKEGKKKEVIFYKNPSLFLKTDEDFDKYTIKKQVSFIDLTTAKLINGRIVLYGDISSYLKLKQLNASRKMFTNKTRIKEGAEVILEKSNIFVLPNKDSERQQYTYLCYVLPQTWLHDIGKENLAKLQEILQSNLVKLWSEHQSKTIQEVSMDNINALRNTITANIVGIIKYLFNKYPGVINMENLMADTGGVHSDKNPENIERQLEWGLYRSFQKLGLVPPRIRSKIFLQKNMKEKRFGVMHFVPTKETSARCPRCLTKAEVAKREADKWGEHAFECTNANCGFSTKDVTCRFEFVPVKNSDDVAACNIANPKFAAIIQDQK